MSWNPYARDDALLQAGLEAGAHGAQQAFDEHDRANRFKLQRAAIREEYDARQRERDQKKITDTAAKLEQFTSVYPEYADKARKIGRALTTEEINDIRETDRSAKKQKSADESQQKIADFVNTHGDENDKALFQATGKMPPKFSHFSASSDPKKAEYKDLDEQLKAFGQDMKYAETRKKSASYDSKREQSDIAANLMPWAQKRAAARKAGQPDPGEYQSPYRRSSTVGDAVAGHEADYWNGVNDMLAVQQRVGAVSKRRLELSGGQPVDPSTAGVYQQPQAAAPAPANPAVGTSYPPPTSTVNYAGPNPTAAPAAAAPQQAQPSALAPLPPEQKAPLLNAAAAAAKASPSAIAQMPPPTKLGASQLLQALQQKISDPTQLRQEYYRMMIEAGFDPSKRAIDTPVPQGQSVLPLPQGQ